MAHVTNELIYEVLKSVQSDISELKFGQQGIRQELSAMRGHLLSMQSDIHNIYLKLDRHEDRLDRIERRLELRELAEPETPYRSDP
ncbi:hypothetical protein SAMN06297251_1177 [Fulvimarina manganoxydans]|uniref:Uncharacterized protein n=1 Tax=Fulvimarina manganoxydans TaxID=937218 RepID=A0A1W2DQI4_9HYPH|nr:hypothetical protein [Fulvimarina manganoxydans]MEE2953100.1 hypothetical protein [Pseudomonadota bacterium]SMC99740.1 hypothetical protein SAMN06297251_1177 [Fulvimarina manganoxydans]